MYNKVIKYPTLDPGQQWELIKRDIIHFSRKYAKEYNCANKNKEFGLIKDLELVQHLNLKEEDPDDLQMMMSYESRVKGELQVIREYKVKSAAFRSKAKWIREGEQNTKYFFSLEKRNYCNKTMYQVRKKNGTLTKDYRENFK